MELSMNTIKLTAYQFSIGFLLVATLSGCASPPKPAECKGPFKPINALEKSTSLGNVNKVVSCNEGVKHGKQG